MYMGMLEKWFNGENKSLENGFPSFQTETGIKNSLKELQVIPVKIRFLAENKWTVYIQWAQ